MIKIQKHFLSAILLSIYSFIAAQTPAEYEANYAKRIKMEMINGVYIPMDLEDAFAELSRLSDPKGIASFKNASDSLIGKSHFGLSQWVQLNWGLDEGSRLSHYMRTLGIPIPEDMARVIVVTYHRYLNGQPLMLEQEIASINKRMLEEKAKRDSMQIIISVEKRPHKE